MALEKDVKPGYLALSRFGYGSRGDGDLGIAASDPRGFLIAELNEPGIALLSGPDLYPSSKLLPELFAFQKQKQAERKAKLVAKADMKAADMTSPAMASAAMQPKPAMAGKMAAKRKGAPPNIIYQTLQSEALARIDKAIAARSGLVERLVAFWSNHFAVSIRKSQIVVMGAGAFEREAIRPHVLGRFKDLVRAVEQHPVMLNFLDQAQSIGPDSPAGKRLKRGLNENLAREIMELHTMGVRSGYSQADVTSFARILTGWSIIGPQGKLGPPGTFIFNRFFHEPGAQKLMGKVYPAGGIEQGEAALDDICARPATAHFIAGKLAAHFIADNPPPALVARLAAVFTKTDGDLKAVTLALINSDEAWSTPLSKIRTPYDFLIAASRAQQSEPPAVGPYFYALKLMGMRLWAPPGPNGWPDTVSAWASPEGMKQRLDIAARIGHQWRSVANPSEVLATIMGNAASLETRQMVARAASRPQGFALLLMSPEFQRS
ncbi:MAG: DUF1800 family protein [Hyphomicrobiales bacterium]|nr:DUF1800 family protein [Hyphomicrobiales bacterium]